MTPTGRRPGPPCDPDERFTAPTSERFSVGLERLMVGFERVTVGLERLILTLPGPNDFVPGDVMLGEPALPLGMRVTFGLVRPIEGERRALSGRSVRRLGVCAAPGERLTLGERLKPMLGEPLKVGLGFPADGLRVTDGGLIRPALFDGERLISSISEGERLVFDGVLLRLTSARGMDGELLNERGSEPAEGERMKVGRSEDDPSVDRSGEKLRCGLDTEGPFVAPDEPIEGEKDLDPSDRGRLNEGRPELDPGLIPRLPESPRKIDGLDEPLDPEGERDEPNNERGELYSESDLLIGGAERENDGVDRENDGLDRLNEGDERPL